MAAAPFRIAAAQIASLRGNMDANLAAHAAAMRAAAKHGVAVLVFPELSLTGYEPDLAADLAITPQDRRLSPLAELAREHQIEAIVGAPLHSGSAKPALGAIVFSPTGTTRTYWKMHLGGSEPNFFVPGDTPLTLEVNGHKAGLAICADSSQPSHPQACADLGANIYAAGVFLNAEWYATDVSRLAQYAASYKLLTVMANHASSVGTYKSVGRSAIWAPGGKLLAQAEGDENALVIATACDGAWQGEVVPM
jgi:predicted amidohydrolase